MHLLVALTILPGVALAVLNGRCTGSAATGDWGTHGICITTTNCANRRGRTTNGACPNDPNNIKCCILDAVSNPCGQTSYCTWTGNGCANSGIWRTGFCPGLDNYRCCRY